MSFPSSFSHFGYSLSRGLIFVFCLLVMGKSLHANPHPLTLTTNQAQTLTVETLDLAGDPETTTLKILPEHSITIEATKVDSTVLTRPTICHFTDGTKALLPMPTSVGPIFVVTCLAFLFGLYRMGFV